MTESAKKGPGVPISRTVLTGPRSVPVSSYLSDRIKRRLAGIPDDIRRSREALKEYIDSVARYWFPNPHQVETEITDSPSDGGLDGYIVDKESRVVVLLQCKWYSPPGKLSLKDSLDLHRFYTLFLKPGQVASLSSEVRAFVVRNSAHYSDYTVRLVYLTSAQLDPFAIREYEKLGIPFEIVDAERFGTQFEAVLSEQSEVHNETVFSLVGDSYLEFEATFPAGPSTGQVKVPVLQCAIRGIDLKRAYRSGKDEVFSRNLRLELKGKINEELAENAESSRRFGFYVLHNGISITCSDYRILALGIPPDGEGMPADMRFVPEADAPFVEAMRKRGAGIFLLLKDFQIVNGAQTTFTLSHLDDGPLLDVTMPCKVSKTTDPLLCSEIAECNNTQNAITAWDLAANSPELTLLQNYASRLSPPIFVQRKRGEKWGHVRFATGSAPTSERTLIAKNVYQAYLAFCGRPGAAYSRPGSAVSPGTPAYTQIQQARDIDAILVAGLLANYEDAIEVSATDPEFLQYWRFWAVALTGHLFRHHLNAAGQEIFKRQLLGSNGSSTWTILRKYMIGLVQDFLKGFSPGADAQYVFKNSSDEWIHATFPPAVTARSIWPYVPTDVKESTFEGMREKDELAKSGIDFYEVNFAILAAFSDDYIRTHPLPSGLY